jgi:xylan 1,4-beta-xylosidase
MKKYILISFLLFASLAMAQYQTQKNTKGAEYFVNPIFAGDYADPSILREGSNYYIVHSSFEYYPGLIIWQSKDLINWTPIANALHKYLGSVWAPDLVKYKNKYYIYFPANNSIYVVTAESINGPWSEPVDLKINLIDPGHIADDAGNRYLYCSNGGFVPLSEDGLSVTGEIKNTYSGWPIPREWSVECFCLESPKLTKRGEYYYLTVAQGGTAGPATSHMVVSARSKSPLGPWENSPYNPIIHTKDVSEKWSSKGHGTIFEDAKGKWWIVFHAYENGYYHMGRQTLLEPIEWTSDGWFKSPDGIRTDKPIRKPIVTHSSSTFSLSDNFDGNQLRPHWQFFGEYNKDRYSVSNNTLVIKAKGDSIGNCSPLLCTPSDHSYITDVEMFIEGKAMGGLVLFYNNSTYSGILADKENILSNLRRWQVTAEKEVIKNHVFLRLKKINSIVDLYYSVDGNKWNKLESSSEVSSFNHNALGGFLSVRIGLCAIGEGKISFKNFRYTAIE